jgi:diacylglycerol kinase family enzyme
MPQRGYGLQPRVAASATLGKKSDLALNRNAVASALCISLWENDATALRLQIAKFQWNQAAIFSCAHNHGQPLAFSEGDINSDERVCHGSVKRT